MANWRSMSKQNKNQNAEQKAFAKYRSGKYTPPTHSSIQSPASEWSTSSGNDFLLSISWFFGAALFLTFNILAPIQMGLDSFEWDDWLFLFGVFPLIVIFFTVLGIRNLQRHLRRKKRIKADSHKPHRKRKRKKD